MHPTTCYHCCFDGACSCRLDLLNCSELLSSPVGLLLPCSCHCRSMCATLVSLCLNQVTPFVVPFCATPYHLTSRHSTPHQPTPPHHFSHHLVCLCHPAPFHPRHYCHHLPVPLSLVLPPLLLVHHHCHQPIIRSSWNTQGDEGVKMSCVTKTDGERLSR